MTSAAVERRMEMVQFISRRGWEPDSRQGPHRWSKQDTYSVLDAELEDAYAIEHRLAASECDAIQEFAEHYGEVISFAAEKLK